MDDKLADVRRKRHVSVSRTPGVKAVERTLSGDHTFELAYTRTGPQGELPVLVFPGGPGLASVLPYRGLRAKAEKLGLDLVMMEHRGIGLSRTDRDGKDLPREAITIVDVLDDAAAVLAAEGINQVIVYGCSYGSYLAQGFGAKYPNLVAGMVLDSAMLSAHDDQTSKRLLRDLFWNGTQLTHSHAATVRQLIDSDVIAQDQVGFPLQFLYESGGLPFVDQMLKLLRCGRGQRVWRWVQRLGSREILRPIPFVMEFDLVGEIAFRELDFAPPLDGDPWEPANAFAGISPLFSAFEREPFDLTTELPMFAWPTVIISGDHDIRTPRTVAEQIATLIPHATLIPVHGHGHSALDTQSNLALDVIRRTVTSIRDAGIIDPAALPSNPQGKAGLMHTIVSARLHLARVVPAPLS